MYQDRDPVVRELGVHVGGRSDAYCPPNEPNCAPEVAIISENRLSLRVQPGNIVCSLPWSIHTGHANYIPVSWLAPSLDVLLWAQQSLKLILSVCRPCRPMVLNSSQNVLTNVHL